MPRLMEDGGRKELVSCFPLLLPLRPVHFGQCRSIQLLLLQKCEYELYGCFGLCSVYPRCTGVGTGMTYLLTALA
jgi:hypothetical protein